jgi:hypothetical protein
MEDEENVLEHRIKAIFQDILLLNQQCSVQDSKAIFSAGFAIAIANFTSSTISHLPYTWHYNEYIKYGYFILCCLIIVCSGAVICPKSTSAIVDDYYQDENDFTLQFLFNSAQSNFIKCKNKIYHKSKYLVISLALTTVFAIASLLLRILVQS